MCLPCRLRGQSQQHRGWWRVCKTSSTLCYWLCSENQEAHSRLWFRILPIYRRVVQNTTIITENAKATNDEKIENLEKELEALNNINESEVSDKQLKEALALLKDGITKKIEFLAGTNEYHKGNKSDDYKEELVKIAYEATDSLLAAEIILK